MCAIRSKHVPDAESSVSLCVQLGANIFLTLKGSVKLGDFGCSVKLKSHTTMPGELVTNAGGVGTPGQFL